MSGPRHFDSPAELAAISAADLGGSSWFLIDRELIERFAQVTGDHQWIHVDPERSAAGPFGAPIAHGYLLLALVPQLLAEVFQIGGVALTVNRGLHEVRFLQPVPAGSRIQLTVSSLKVRPRPQGRWQADVSTAARLADTDKIAFSARVDYLYQQDMSVLNI